MIKNAMTDASEMLTEAGHYLVLPGVQDTNIKSMFRTADQQQLQQVSGMCT